MHMTLHCRRVMVWPHHAECGDTDCGRVSTDVVWRDARVMGHVRGVSGLHGHVSLEGGVVVGVVDRRSQGKFSASSYGVVTKSFIGVDKVTRLDPIVCKPCLGCVQLVVRSTPESV